MHCTTKSRNTELSLKPSRSGATAIDCQISTTRMATSSSSCSVDDCDSKELSTTTTTTTKTFQDTSTDCAICLLPLYDTVDEHDGDNNSNVITLSCGHKWHLDCLKSQLEHAQPNSARRLVFKGCTCAKCGQVCSTDHPQLQNLTRKIDFCRQKVDLLIQEQLKIDKIQIDDDDDETDTTKPSGGNKKEQEMMDLAYKKYAFYLCSSCQEPYFGGLVECADTSEGEIQNAKDRLCVGCSSSSSTHGIECRNKAQHRSFLVWKCRYCCQPSTYVCYGNTHFCTNCHQRNNERVKRNSKLPLQPIPCPGGAGCNYPKPSAESTHHNNGSTSTCEQIYGCTLCASSVSGSSQGRWDIPNGSPNLISSPSGEHGLRGWQPLMVDAGQGSRFMRRQTTPWQIETSDLPTVSALDNNDSASSEQQSQPTPLILTNFVSSYNWCQMVQNVPLHKYVRNTAEIGQIEIAAQYRGRTDCPSIFKLEAIVVNTQNIPIYRIGTPILEAPQDDWDRARLFVDVQSIMNSNTNNDNAIVHSLLIIIHGKDQRFWQGLYGSKVCDCSVRILGSQQELQEKLVMEEIVNIDNDTQSNNGGGGGGVRRVRPYSFSGGGEQRQGQREQDGLRQRRQRRGRGQEPRIRQQEQRYDPIVENQRQLLRQGVLPLVCFILFLWLMSS